MAGQEESPSRKAPETIAVSSGDSSVEKDRVAMNGEAATLAGINSADATSPGAPIHAAGAPSSGTKKESSSVFRSIGATVFQPGDLLGGRYEITKLLGMGGMGAVYKAHDIEVARTVGLKVIRPDLAENPAILARFKQELVLARQITHKNIIRIYDLNEADGVKFITMEFIEGEDLRTILTRQGKLSPEEAVEILHQTCAGLNAAHSEGVIHRDLKPANIMRDQSGRVVIMDFGLARTLQGEGMTQTGMMVGTMEYMSPEQATGLELDATSDIYAVGLIAYEMLTGKMPYAADSAVASLLKRSQERAKPMIDVDSSIPRDLSTIVSRCIEPDRKKRYQNTAELIADLDAFQPSAASKAAGSVAVRRPPFKAARTIPAWAKWGAVSVLALLVLGVGLYEWKSRHKPQVAHAPVSVLVADFTNHTGDPVLDGTLEPMFNVALEGASFINAFNRGTARKLAQKLPNPTDKLDEQSARLVALSQGISSVITGEISLRGDAYTVSAMALDAATGKVLAKSEATAANKDAVVGTVPKVVAPIRAALGDTTPESTQIGYEQGAFTAASIEVVHQYSLAGEQQLAGNMEEAMRHFEKAVQLDPNFSRAYSGMAAMAFNLGQRQSAEENIKLAMEHVDHMTERERYRNRGQYYWYTNNTKKAVEDYKELLAHYPSDLQGLFNLAAAYIDLHDFANAVEQVRRAVEIAPKRAITRQALSFYSSYVGDFHTGEQEARAAIELSPSSEISHLALAEAQLGQGQLSQAAETYHKLEKLSPVGASMAASGFADLAVYEGRFADAVRILEQGAAADLAAKNPEYAANKFAALGHTQLLRGQNRAALDATEKLLASSKSTKARFLAAQNFVEAGELAKAEKLVSALGSEMTPEAQASAKIIQGQLALKRGDAPEAIKALTEANNLLDTWMGHYQLARAYLEAGAFVEADAELDRLLKRRGESLELWLNNVPTYGYFPPVYYLQGRVREGLKSLGFAESYRTYLGIRGQAGEDPLIPEIRRRLGQ